MTIADSTQLAVQTVAGSFRLGLQLAAPVVVFSVIFNVAAFRDEHKDMQLSVFTATTGAASVIRNAAGARIQGLEFETVLKPLPSLTTSAEAWILSGGAHHTVLSYQLDAEHMHDLCEILGIEFIHIGKDTTIEQLEKELFWNDMTWKLKG